MLIPRLGSPVLPSPLRSGSLILLLLLLAPWIVLTYVLSGWLQIGVFITLPAFAIWSMRKEIAHPLGIFSFFYIFYSIAFPTLAMSSEYYADPEILHGVLFAEALGYAGFVVGTSSWPRKRLSLFSAQWTRHSGGYHIGVISIPPVALFLVFLASAYPLQQIVAHGFSTKQEIKGSGRDFLVYLGFFSLLANLLALQFIYLYERGYAKAAFVLAGGGIIYLLVSFGISGEREALLGFPLILLLYFSEVRRTISGKLVIASLVGGVFVVSISHWFKGFLIGGGSHDWQDRYSQGVLSVLQGDFASAGNNLYIVLEQVTFFMEGERLIGDIERILTSRFLDIGDAISSTDWFMNVFLQKSGAGAGFSMVALGYVDFGYPGVLFIMFLVGFILQAFARYRRLNSMVYVAYIHTLLMACYSLRADFSNFVNNSLKLGIFPILLIFLYRQVTQRRRFTKRQHKSAIDANPATDDSDKWR